MAAMENTYSLSIAHRLHAHANLKLGLDVSRSLVFKIKTNPDYGGDLKAQQRIDGPGSTPPSPQI
jgi:hypothetical protein